MESNEVRAHLLGTLKNMKDEHPDFLLVAYRVYPNYRQLLQEMVIN